MRPGSGSRGVQTFGNNNAADLLAVAEHFMTGEILYRAGHPGEAFAELREAVRCQDLLRYSEPPDWILPVRHALGAALLQSGRFEEAERVYRDDLERLPENGWSLFGLARSLELQGKTDRVAAGPSPLGRGLAGRRRHALLVLLLPARGLICEWGTLDRQRRSSLVISENCKETSDNRRNLREVWNGQSARASEASAREDV